MIYTVTLNPSIDCYMTLDSLTEESASRAKEELITYGGKGINVSLVLSSLGIENIALGFIAGPNGKAISEGLKGKINTDLITLREGNSRINFKIRSKGKETEINGAGPLIDSNSLDQLFDRFRSLSKDDLVILSGSVPPGLPSTVYAGMAEVITSAGASFIIDTTGDNLMNALPYKPLVIKPNLKELEDVFEKKTDPLDLDTIYDLARILQKKGAVEVIVSLGKDGAVLLDEKGEVTYFTAFKGNVVSTVCAGDSLLAGFVAGKKKGLSSAGALELGVAAGSACAFSSELPSKEEIYALLGRSL